VLSVSQRPDRQAELPGVAQCGRIETGMAFAGIIGAGGMEFLPEFMRLHGVFLCRSGWNARKQAMD
jgi:hypothetical protein